MLVRGENLPMKYPWGEPRGTSWKCVPVTPWPISRPCTFPPAHWRLILLIHDFSLVIGGKLHSEYLVFFLIGGKLFQEHSLSSSLAARLQTHTIFSLNIPNISLYNASYYMCRKITSHWPFGSHFSLRKWRRRPHFPTKLAAVASFSYKIGGGGLIFLQNWRQRHGFGNITGGCSDMVWILAHWGRKRAEPAKFCIEAKNVCSPPF